MRLEQLNDRLHAFREEVGSKWSKLTKADLEHVECDLQSLSGVIAKRYGIPAKRARVEAEEFAASFGTTFKEAAGLVGDAARDLWRNGRHHVSDAVSSGTQKATDLWESGREQMRDLQHRAEKVIGNRPLTSLAVAAGVGALIAILVRRR